MHLFHKQSFRSIALLAGVLVALSSPSARAGFVNDASSWLISQQDGSGGFPSMVGGAVTTNTQGPTALGLLEAYDFTQQNAYLNSAVMVGDYLLTSPAKFSDMDPNIALHDPLFLEVLSTSSADPQYADFVQTNFWDKLTAGTYGETNNQDAAGLAASLNAFRVLNSEIGLAPWDLSKAAIAAQVAGEGSIRDAFMGGILDGLNSAIASDTPFDLLGLSGAIQASAITGIDLDPTVGRWAAFNSTADLANELLNFINPVGGWVFRSDKALSNLNNGDTQVTAAALLALEALDPALYADEILGGREYLISLQQPSGQVLRFPGAAVSESGGVQIHGEALTALVPEPSVLALMTIGGGLAMIRRKRRTNP